MLNINKDFWQNLESKKLRLYGIFLFFWLVLAMNYLERTPHDHRTHDINGHINYTLILINQNRLALPYEGWETFHPPVYYIINSNIEKELVKKGDIAPHIKGVRSFSILYGLGSIAILAWFINKLQISTFSKLLVLGFITTTPKFLFLFTTYNNDSLSTFICFTIIWLSYKLYFKDSKDLSILLFLICAIGLHVKYSCTGCIIAIATSIKAYEFYKKKKSATSKKLILVLLSSLLSLIPWLYFHNYKHTKKYFPENLDYLTHKGDDIKGKWKTLTEVLKLPDKNEWKHPFCYGRTADAEVFKTNKTDFFSFFFIDSIIGENLYSKPSMVVFRIILLINLFLFVLALINPHKGISYKLCVIFILIGIIINLFNTIRYKTILISLFGFRYVAWIWLPQTILYGISLKRNNTYEMTIKALLVVGILINIYILMTITGGLTRY